MIAIVGNGPSPVGKGWGARIDACATVIRMADWGWQDGEDYGTKYDIGILCAPRRRLDWELDHAARVPARTWWLFDTHKLLPDVAGTGTALGVPYVKMPHEMVDDALRRMAAGGAANTRGYRLALTRGLAAVLMARLTWPRARIIVVGFDVLKAGCTPATEDGYPAAALRWRRERGASLHAWTAGESANRSHDYAAEGRMMHGFRPAIQWGFE